MRGRRQSFLPWSRKGRAVRGWVRRHLLELGRGRGLMRGRRVAPAGLAGWGTPGRWSGCEGRPLAGWTVEEGETSRIPYGVGEGDLPSFGWGRPPEFCRDERWDVVRRWGFGGSGCGFGFGMRTAGAPAMTRVGGVRRGGARRPGGSCPFAPGGWIESCQSRRGASVARGLGPRGRVVHRVVPEQWG